MLKRISFENYKAFDNGSIEIRPLTILLGANSVGKSSILQLLLLLQQTSEADKTYKSALKLNGGYISLGEGLNLIRNKDAKKALVLSFDFQNQDLFERLSTGLLSNYCSLILFSASYFNKIYNKPSSFIDNLLKSFGMSGKKGEKNSSLHMLLYDSGKKGNILSRLDFEELINSLSKIVVGDEFIKDDDIDYIYYQMKFGPGVINTLKNDKDEYLMVYDFLSGISKLNLNQNFNIKYSLLNTLDNTIRIKEISLTANNKFILSIEFSDDVKSSKVKFKSPFLDSSLAKSNILIDKIGKGLDPSKTIFEFLIANEERSSKDISNFTFTSIIYNITKTFVKSVQNSFSEDKINYVSPLRAHPKRYYFLDKAKINKYLDTLDGDSLTEILRENNYLKIQVNSWLSKFNLQIDVDQLKDIIHKLVVKQNSLNLDITDVGFGISQVLPVIVQGFLSSRDSLTIIEQPEIHLHPKMQADLADLFIDIVQDKKSDTGNKYNKYLLIETHSEYLLKRLRRRISEGVINNKNVAIYLIDPQKDGLGAKVKLLDVEEKGNFEWPTDFYSNELMSDTFEFLKNQH
ncbi:AAA family ATPase [Fibrella forsythiae]|uniref:AAA family ATPase n=1 Tax=Fibrella forsythiae TaxID=2817061 RepID=A0ABS3JSJ3_9BACT|nr:AAA family ATPase [Fibrella forsythiae]MBO0952987.1 AAA family ATPase [Fibrella forsythiae]